MRRTRFDDWPCPIARVADLVGDWWTPLVLRQSFYGTRRFDDFVTALGIPRPVLTKRLARLVEEGLLEKQQYEARPPRWEYRLTEKGRAFWDVLAAMWSWGMEWQWSDDDPALMLVDRETGAEVRPAVVDATTGEPLDVRRLRLSVRAQERAVRGRSRGIGGARARRRAGTSETRAGPAGGLACAPSWACPGHGRPRPAATRRRAPAAPGRR